MLVHDRHVWRLFFGSLIAVILGAFLIWNQLPVQDPIAYFNFADQRMYLGIPNFFDVISNLLFIYVGLWGILSAFSPQLWMSRPKALMVTLFFVNASVFLTGWGSSYFHMTPNNITLFWDRAPMAMGFMALFALIMVDRGPDFFWQVWVVPLMALGVYTAWVGSYGSMDIRYYILVQFGGLILALIFVLCRRAVFLNNKLMYTAFLFYALAKLVEGADHEVLTRFAFSGHTLKHICAALAIFAINLAVQIPVKYRPKF